MVSFIFLFSRSFWVAGQGTRDKLYHISSRWVWLRLSLYKVCFWRYYHSFLLNWGLFSGAERPWSWLWLETTILLWFLIDQLEQIIVVGRIGAHSAFSYHNLIVIVLRLVTDIIEYRDGQMRVQRHLILILLSRRLIFLNYVVKCAFDLLNRLFR